VEAFDTNVVVRLLVRDDEEQYQRAELVLRLPWLEYTQKTKQQRT